MMATVQRMADTIASEVTISIQGTKTILQHTRDHGVSEALEFMARWNASKPLSPDLKAALSGGTQRDLTGLGDPSSVFVRKAECMVSRRNHQ